MKKPFVRRAARDGIFGRGKLERPLESRIGSDLLHFFPTTVKGIAGRDVKKTGPQ